MGGQSVGRIFPTATARRLETCAGGTCPRASARRRESEGLDAEEAESYAEAIAALGEKGGSCGHRDRGVEHDRGCNCLGGEKVERPAYSERGHDRHEVTEARKIDRCRQIINGGEHVGLAARIELGQRSGQRAGRGGVTQGSSDAPVPRPRRGDLTLFESDCELLGGGASQYGEKERIVNDDHDCVDPLLVGDLGIVRGDRLDKTPVGAVAEDPGHRSAFLVIQRARVVAGEAV